MKDVDKSNVKNKIDKQDKLNNDSSSNKEHINTENNNINNEEEDDNLNIYEKINKKTFLNYLGFDYFLLRKFYQEDKILTPKNIYFNSNIKKTKYKIYDAVDFATHLSLSKLFNEFFNQKYKPKNNSNQLFEINDIEEREVKEYMSEYLKDYDIFRSNLFELNDNKTNNLENSKNNDNNNKDDLSDKGFNISSNLIPNKIYSLQELNETKITLKNMTFKSYLLFFNFNPFISESSLHLINKKNMEITQKSTFFISPILIFNMIFMGSLLIRANEFLKRMSRASRICMIFANMGIVYISSSYLDESIKIKLLEKELNSNNLYKELVLVDYKNIRL